MTDQADKIIEFWVRRTGGTGRLLPGSSVVGGFMEAGDWPPESNGEVVELTLRNERFRVRVGEAVLKKLAGLPAGAGYHDVRRAMAGHVLRG